jgi:hypothetical protein
MNATEKPKRRSPSENKKMNKKPKKTSSFAARAGLNATGVGLCCQSGLRCDRNRLVPPNQA